MRLVLLLSAILTLAPALHTDVREDEQERPLPLPRARVEVERGRFLLVEGREVFSLLAGESREVARSAHLEGGTRSEVEVAWRGLASIRVRGSASFGFEPRDEPPFRPVLSFLHFASLDLEVRRGSVGLLLPQGWSLRVDRAALYVRELPDGSLELVHRGGKPVSVWSRVEREEEAPETLSSGQELRLPALPPASSRGGD